MWKDVAIHYWFYVHIAFVMVIMDYFKTNQIKSSVCLNKNKLMQCMIFNPFCKCQTTNLTTIAKCEMVLQREAALH